jgi:hypothetical protein
MGSFHLFIFLWWLLQEMKLLIPWDKRIRMEFIIICAGSKIFNTLYSQFFFLGGGRLILITYSEIEPFFEVVIF